MKRFSIALAAIVAVGILLAQSALSCCAEDPPCVPVICAVTLPPPPPGI